MSLVTPLTRTVFRSEMRRLLRDKRALLSAVVLPMLLFPVMFLGMDKLEEEAQVRVESKEVSVAHDLSALDERAAAEILAMLEAGTENSNFVPAPEGFGAKLAGMEIEALREEALDEERDLVLVGGLDEASGTTKLAFYYNGSRENSEEARDRVRGAIREWISTTRSERMVALLGSDPGKPLESSSTDLATAEDAAGHELGSLLPLLAVLMIVSGASFAALDAFAGERESGTLETLLVNPVPASAIARGKFLAVILTGLAALIGNVGSFVFCLVAGLGSLGSEVAGAAVGSTLIRAFGGMLLFLPTACLLSALLCLISARAKSFREGQNYILPLVLLVMGPAAMGTIDQVTLDPLLAMIPIAGTSIAFRDALGGSLSPMLGALVLLAQSGWAWLALRKLDETLDAERWLAAPAKAEEYGADRTAAGRALGLGVLCAFAIYFVGGRLQAISVVPGLLATLWILAPLLAVFVVRVTGDERIPWNERFGLVRPPATGIVAAVLFAIAAVPAAHSLAELQSRFLPMPDMLLPPELMELSLLQLLFVAAITPGICEEFLFRGALLGGMRRHMKPAKLILWQAILFGAVHASIYRFAITGLLGALLTFVTLRTRSLWPAIVLHATYNGLQVWHGHSETEPSHLLALAALPAFFLVTARRR